MRIASAAWRRRMRLRFRSRPPSPRRMRVCLAALARAQESNRHRQPRSCRARRKADGLAGAARRIQFVEAARGPEVFGDARPFAQLEWPQDRSSSTVGSGVGTSARRRPSPPRRGCRPSRRRASKRSRKRSSCWVDGIDAEPALEQRLDHRVVRHLDRDMDLAGIRRPALRHRPATDSPNPRPPWQKIFSPTSRPSPSVART